MDPKRPDVRGVSRDDSRRPGPGKPRKPPRAASRDAQPAEPGSRARNPRNPRPRPGSFRLTPLRTWFRARTEVTDDGERRLGLWLGSFRISGVTILVVILTIMGVGVLGPQINILVQQRRDVADLAEQVRQQQLAIEDIEKQRARWDDPAYVRAQARERLFYVMPGDISFIVISDVPVAEKSRDKPSTTVQSTKSDWMRGIFNSVMVAGLSTATPAQLGAATKAAGTQ